MGIGKKLKELIEDKKVNVNELSSNIEVSAQTLYSIIKRDNLKIDFDVLLKICNFFNVKPEYFYEEYESETKITSNELTEEQLSLLDRYNLLDLYGKKAIDTLLDIEYERCTANNEDACTLEKVAEKPALYLVKHKVKVVGQVAAGLPIEAIEDISFLEVDNIPHGTDYALKVNGDSMKPLIQNGSLIFIHSQPNIDVDGEICVVQYNNEATCKKVYRKDGYVELVSINPEYKPMIIRHEDFKILGKVILN